MKNKICSLLLGSLSYCLTIVGDQTSNDIEKLSKSSLDMGSKIYKLSETLSCVFSPYSIFSSIAMAYEGSDGDTAKELAQMLSLSISKEELSPLAGIWKAALLKNNSLELANALWVQNDFMILPSYQSCMEVDYQAGLYSLDLRNAEEASTTINEWVREKTHDMIPKFLDSSDLNDATRMIAMSTLFFKENWVKPFISIGACPFDTEKGIAFIKMMKKIETCSYTENESLQMASIPLDGEKSTLVVVLPRSEEDLKNFEENLSSDTLESLLSSTYSETLHIEMPKFMIKQKSDLSSLLKKSGITIPFSKYADFSKINGARNLCIDSILHAAVFSLDEQGIKASAVTGTSLGLTSFPSDPDEEYKLFLANRPFLFFLMDSSTKAVLMMGKFSPTADHDLSN